MKIASFFSGAGGLDLVFDKAGYEIIYANEYDKTIWETYRQNFNKTLLVTENIIDIDPKKVPKVDGIIGGPPCQSWSVAGSMRGPNDSRGKLFHNFIDIIDEVQPYFFLAENVAGMLAPRNIEAIENIEKMFEEKGYLVSKKLLNVSDYGVPQDRKRVIFVGYHKKKMNGKRFVHPKPTSPDEAKKRTLKQTIYNLRNNAKKAGEKNYSRGKLTPLNHEYMHGGFSSIYLSRNRVRSWNEQSFTIQAGGRHAPIHPNAPKMIKREKDKQVFKPGKEKLYRRMSVRECALIQTFPEDFEFIYKKISDGYKMIGNAVPVDFAEILAKEIMKDLSKVLKK
ncbi:DNA cytosine methyltransferase [Methylophilaceae bacterium]|nr:DNA cytosine methyltransferase [Methylophilaceae bacterium]